MQEAEDAHAGLLEAAEYYLGEAWKNLNGPLCIKCHNVGTRKFKVSDPAKDVQGPNLNVVQDRLRSDWVKLWLYNPAWVTPYTSMPLNFPKNNTTQFPDLLGGDPDAHVISVRDALLNYNKLMEDVGPVTYGGPPAAGTAPSEPEKKADTPAADADAAAKAQIDTDGIKTGSTRASEKSSSVALKSGRNV